MTRIPTGSTVSFNHPDTGRIVDGRIVEHKITAARGHRYRVRVVGSNKRIWLDTKDMVEQ